MGLEVEAGRGEGYRLPVPVELLSTGAVFAALDAETRMAIEGLDVLFAVDSTSTRLMAAQAPAPGRLRACVAEYQADGRGRRGRQWLSPLGSGVCFSASWRYEVPPRDLPALSLAVGVAVVEAFEKLGARGVQLKWPNDVVAGAGKLAGILVDVSGESGGPLKVVIGIGSNMRLAPGLRAALAADTAAMPAIGLDAVVPTGPPSRNGVVAELLVALRHVLAEFGRDGFAPFADRWCGLDFLSGRNVTVTSGGRTTTGIARGIGPDGALLVDSGGGIRVVMAGDVTLRGAL